MGYMSGLVFDSYSAKRWYTYAQFLELKGEECRESLDTWNHGAAGRHPASLMQGAWVAQWLKSWASAPRAWVRTLLSARGFLDASPQRGGFTCIRTRLSSALKFSSRGHDMWHTHWHLKNWILGPGNKTTADIRAIKPTHTYKPHAIVCRKIRSNPILSYPFVH